MDHFTKRTLIDTQMLHLPTFSLLFFSKKRALHHDDQRRRHPGLAQSVHWARTSTRDLTAVTVRALLASEVRTEDGLLTDGAVLGTTEEEEEEGVIRWGHANRVGCGWIQAKF